jgi:hypothetical protein
VSSGDCVCRVVGDFSVVDHVSKSILPQRVLCRGELRFDQLDGDLFGKGCVYSVLGLGIEYFVRQQFRIYGVVVCDYPPHRIRVVTVVFCVCSDSLAGFCSQKGLDNKE